MDTHVRAGDRSPWSLVATGTKLASWVGATPQLVPMSGKAMKGDFLVAAFAGRNSTPGDMTGGDPWSDLFYRDLGGQEYHRLWWKVAGANEPTTYTQEMVGSSDPLVIAISCWRQREPKDLVMPWPLKTVRYATDVLPISWAPKEALYIALRMCSLEDDIEYPRAPLLQGAMVAYGSNQPYISMAYLPVIEDRGVGGWSSYPDVANGGYRSAHSLVVF